MSFYYLRKYQIRGAQLKDCDSIMMILKENLISLNDTINLSTMFKQTGFLVYPFTKTELSYGISNPKNHIILVCNCEEKVVGYVLSYDIQEWFRLKPNTQYQFRNIDTINNLLLHHRILYLRHIARKHNTKGVGGLLLNALLKEAQKQTYNYIFADIMEAPYINKVSTQFFKKFGFEKIASYDIDSIKWGIFHKKLYNET